MKDSIRELSPAFINRRIDRKTLASLQEHENAPTDVIKARLCDLDCETDVVSAKLSGAIMIGLVTGALALADRKRFAAAPLIGFAAILAPCLVGFHPLLMAARLLGFRSAKEIEIEHHALKTIRGDFHRFEMDPTPKGAFTAANGETGIEALKTETRGGSVTTSHGLEQHPI